MNTGNFKKRKQGDERMNEIVKTMEIEESEFDWFPEGVEEPGDTDEYSEIPDLSIAVRDMEIKKKKDILDGVVYESGNVEESRRFSEGLDGSMNAVFSSVYEKLCGGRVEINSGRPMEVIEILNKKCEVLQTEMCGRSGSEMAARIEACLDEKGCVIAIVDNEKLSMVLQENGFTESEFMDCGLRTLEIIDYKEEKITIHMFENGQEHTVLLFPDEFSQLEGILLEVLK